MTYIKDQYEFEKKYLHKKLHVDTKELSSYSDSKLATFSYGLYSDNALTYLMRVDQQRSFEYVIRRGIPLTSADRNGNNVLHFAVSLERLDYLSYLLDGSYGSYMKIQIFDYSLDNILAHLQKHPWIESAWEALDKCNWKDGQTPFLLGV